MNINVAAQITRTHLLAKKRQTLGVTFGIAMFITIVSFMQGVNQFLDDRRMYSPFFATLPTQTTSSALTASVWSILMPWRATGRTTVAKCRYCCIRPPNDRLELIVSKEKAAPFRQWFEG